MALGAFVSKPFPLQRGWAFRMKSESQARRPYQTRISIR